MAERRVAARKLLLDSRGELNHDARRVAAYLKRVCEVGKKAEVLDQQGRTDPVATACRAVRREVWDHLVGLLQLDVYTVVNLREED